MCPLRQVNFVLQGEMDCGRVNNITLHLTPDGPEMLKGRFLPKKWYGPLNFDELGNGERTSGCNFRLLRWWCRSVLIAHLKFVKKTPNFD